MGRVHLLCIQLYQGYQIRTSHEYLYSRGSCSSCVVIFKVLVTASLTLDPVHIPKPRKENRHDKPFSNPFKVIHCQNMYCPRLVPHNFEDTYRMPAWFRQLVTNRALMSDHRPQHLGFGCIPSDHLSLLPRHSSTMPWLLSPATQTLSK